MNVWKVLVVGGDAESRAPSINALMRLEYRGRGILAFEARDAADARSILSVHPDIAAVILTFTQDDSFSGLEFAKWLRRERRNDAAQIVALTPTSLGADEELLAREYEISAFLEKPGLTPNRIRTSAITALRSYDALTTVRDRHGDLKRINEITARLFRNGSLADFERETIDALAGILHGTEGEGRYFGVFASRGANEATPRITTATARFRHLQGQKLSQLLEPADFERVMRHNYAASHLSLGRLRAYGFRIRDGSEAFIVLEDPGLASDWNRDLLEGLRLNLGAAVENYYLYHAMESSRDDLVFALGEMAESRSEETWNHVKRVAAITHILAQGMGMGEFESDQLRMAASLHDLGKLSIPEEILAKPGVLSAVEFESMKGHARVGFEMLQMSDRDLFRVAAKIALEHHENWDGSGYPQGLKGEEISLYSRIVAVADVFDALGNRRAYKKPWESADILEFMYKQTGRKFDPRVMDVFFERLDELNRVRNRLPD